MMRLAGQAQYRRSRLNSNVRPHEMPAAVIPASIREFWSVFTDSLEEDPSARFYEAFHFDDNQPSADELAALVLCGRKRATAGLVAAYASEGKPIPKPRDLSVVTLFSGEPVCVIETRKVEIVPFSAVGAEFAATEGEGDGSLQYWKEAHADYFGRECTRLGVPFEPNIAVVCEQFEVIFRGRGENAA
jgi:uncharacterized protein YhfF